MSISAADEEQGTAPRDVVGFASTRASFGSFRRLRIRVEHASYGHMAVMSEAARAVLAGDFA